MPNSLDSEILIGLRELKTDDEPHFLKNFMLLFLESVPSRIDLIKSAIDEKNLTKLMQESHALKSSCASVGATQLTALCHELEKIGRGQSNSDKALLFAQLIKEFDVTKAEILSLPELS